jgi:acetyltransferase-like isoleucine patch superfamily enzyme
MNRYYKLLRYDWPLHFVLLFTNWFPDNVLLIKFRGFLARPFFKKTGFNLQIGRDVTFYNPSKISLGNNVYVAKGCWFSAGEQINIGSNILFGPYVVIVTSNHSLKDGSYFFGDPVDIMPVNIYNGCWIGAHVTILSGSCIEEGTLIAANTVFKGNSEKFSIFAGNPAKFVKYVKNE